MPSWLLRVGLLSATNAHLCGVRPTGRPPAGPTVCPFPRHASGQHVHFPHAHRAPGSLLLGLGHAEGPGGVPGTCPLLSSLTRWWRECFMHRDRCFSTMRCGR